MGSNSGQVNALVRFFSRVEINDETGCWEWTATKNVSGYGQFAIDGSTVPAHRWIYEQVRGHIPAGYVVDHHCMNPCCVHPRHLEAVPHLVNMQRQRRTKQLKQIARQEHESEKPALQDRIIACLTAHPDGLGRRDLCRYTRGSAQAIQDTLDVLHGRGMVQSFPQIGKRGVRWSLLASEESEVFGIRTVTEGQIAGADSARQNQQNEHLSTVSVSPRGQKGPGTRRQLTGAEFLRLHLKNGATLIGNLSPGKQP